MIFLRTLLSFLKDREYRGLLFASGFIVVIGTVVYHYVEAWSWLDSLYFSVITLTTIGFGDFAPQFQRERRAMLQSVNDIKTD
jgi:hypothetical protein